MQGWRAGAPASAAAAPRAQPEDVAQAALLAFGLGSSATLAEIVLNRAGTPFRA